MLAEVLTCLAQRRRADDRLGAAVVDDVGRLGRGQVGVDRDVVQTAAARRPHDGVEVLVVLHQNGDGVALAQTVLAEEVGEAVGARLEFGERQHRPRRMDDDGGLVGVGGGMFANLHGPNLRRPNLTGVKTPLLTSFAQGEPTIRSPGIGGASCSLIKLRAHPQASLTFLFTDIEGSTRRWEADADAMQVALETHNKVLRGAVEANDGKVFNYTGDGMCAVFASPRSAVDAAVAAQSVLELPVRMGIATGEAELRDGDYFGTVLNRTARVMAAGHGGQILLDGATAALLTGVDLIDLGPRQLRDIAKPVAMYQVRAPGLRLEFPPLNTLDATPGNLRHPTTSFIGRDSELTELATALTEHRLLTLTGVGGVGKTRLALEVAACASNDYPDGVFVIELAAVGDPAAVPEAVAAVLGVTQQTGMSLAESVAAALERRSRLLISTTANTYLTPPRT